LEGVVGFVEEEGGRAFALDDEDTDEDDDSDGGAARPVTVDEGAKDDADEFGNEEGA